MVWSKYIPLLTRACSISSMSRSIAVDGDKESKGGGGEKECKGTGEGSVVEALCFV